jgi:hypothetical protein
MGKVRKLRRSREAIVRLIVARAGLADAWPGPEVSATRTTGTTAAVLHMSASSRLLHAYSIGLHEEKRYGA